MGVRRIYKSDTPYNAVELAGLDFDQTNDGMYTVHIDKPPAKVVRYGHTDWRWSGITFGPTISPPTALSATPTGSTGDVGYSATDYEYAVTSVSETGQESRISGSASCVNDLTLDGHYNTVNWTADPDAASYIVYKNSNGVLGYIGVAVGTTFKDTNIIADQTNTPPKGTNYFDGVGKYPSIVGFHGQRLMFGASKLYPNRVWSSQVADFENLDNASPAKPDDAFEQALVGKQAVQLTQIVSASDLVILTTRRTFLVEDLTAQNFLPKGQGSRGTSRLKALDIDETLFVQPIQGKTVRALNYSAEARGFQSTDVSIFSSHLFKGDTIKAWAYQAEPFSVIWAVMASGRLLCFTWQREQEVWGWSRCSTKGWYEDVAVITENGFDRAYFIVRRVVGEETVRFYERMALPHDTDFTDACPLDCAITKLFDEPSTEVTGLWHLEGETVVAFADGYEYRGLVVLNGKVTIPQPCLKVSVGLPFVCEVEPLPLVLDSNQGSRHVNHTIFEKVVVRTIDTKGIEAQTLTGAWEYAPERQGDDLYGWVPDIKERDYEIVLDAAYASAPTVKIRQAHAFPLHITALFIVPITGQV